MKNKRKQIIVKVAHCNVFINNAHEDFGQVKMLNELFTEWKMENKLIINIGVDTVPYSNWQVVHKQYPVEKVALHAQCELLQNDELRKCKITNLALGYVDTEFNKDYDGPKLSYKKKTKLFFSEDCLSLESIRIIIDKINLIADNISFEIYNDIDSLDIFNIQGDYFEYDLRK